jgi:hypothetical protein
MTLVGRLAGWDGCGPNGRRRRGEENVNKRELTEAVAEPDGPREILASGLTMVLV